MIERADINGLLSQMRAIRTEMQQGVAPIARPEFNTPRDQSRGKQRFCRVAQGGREQG